MNSTQLVSARAHRRLAYRRTGSLMSITTICLNSYWHREGARCCFGRHVVLIAELALKKVQVACAKHGGRLWRGTCWLGLADGDWWPSLRRTSSYHHDRRASAKNGKRSSEFSADRPSKCGCVRNVAAVAWVVQISCVDSSGQLHQRKIGQCETEGRWLAPSLQLRGSWCKRLDSRTTWQKASSETKTRLEQMTMSLKLVCW